MPEISNCPNCKAELKNGVLSSIKMLDDDKTRVINEYHTSKAEGYCNKCGKQLYDEYVYALKNEREKITDSLQKLISIVPVVSTHSPLNWNYDILEMVTGQTTTGTGAASEFISDYTDLFGMQSREHNKKLKSGEDLCFAQLRKQTLNLGGNAIIATDIDYSEMGAPKGMIMVCMAGTAVRLKNLDVLGEKKAKLIDELGALNQRVGYLNDLI